MKKIKLVGFTALGLGMLAVLVVYLMTGGRFLENTERVVPRQVTFRQEEVKHLEIDIDVTDVEVLGADVQEVTVDYGETKDTKYQVVAESGTLFVKSQTKKNWLFDINLGFFFGNEEDREVKITLPRELLTSLKADIDVGDLIISNITVGQDGYLKSEVGDTELENVKVNGKLTVEQDVGDLEFSNLLIGQSLEIDANVGDVSGNIADEMNNYTITSSVNVGDNNLPTNMNGGDKVLDVRGDVGDVSIEFKP